MITLSSGMVSIVTSNIVENISAYLCQDATLYLEVQVPSLFIPFSFLMTLLLKIISLILMTFNTAVEGNIRPPHCLCSINK